MGGPGEGPAEAGGAGSYWFTIGSGIDEWWHPPYGRFDGGSGVPLGGRRVCGV